MEAYLQLLRQQIEKNRLMNELARRGKEAISTGNIVPVIEGDAIRQQIMIQVRSLQAEMDRHLKNPPGDPDLLPSPCEDEIRAAHNELQSIVSDTLAIDEHNRSTIRKIRTAVGEKLEDIGRGRKALDRYRTPALKKPKLFDGQG
jgi:hypothetical protein